MENQKPKALQCAEHLEQFRSFEKDLEAAAELRRLHARVQELEAMLDAVGTGGVSAQRVTQAADHIEQPLEMVAAPVLLPEPIGYAHQGQLDNISDGYAYVYQMESPSTSCKLYTEQQVRELLASPQPQADAMDAGGGI